MGRVQDKVAFVTGVARGQGREHALLLAEEGADIIGVDICNQIDTVPWPMATVSDLEETIRLVEATGQRIIAEQGDVRDLSRLTDVVRSGVDELGRLDIVCANAGIGSFSPTIDMTEPMWQDMIDVNLTGVWNTVKAALPHLLSPEADGGSIVITSSTAGLVAIPNMCHYSAAKTGLVGLARSLAQELGPNRIRVNTVHPTGVATPMLHNEVTYRLFMPDAEHPTMDDAAKIHALQNAIPVPWIEPRDVSNAVLFLASNESRFVTGCTLTVDAGATIKYPGT